MNARFLLFILMAVLLSGNTALSNEQSFEGASTQASDENPKLDEKIAEWGRSQPGLQKSALGGLLFTRCAHYLRAETYISFVKDAYTFECAMTARKFIQILKPTIVKFDHPLSGVRMNLQAAFTDDLPILIQAPQVAAFLDAWMEELQMASIGVRPLDTFALATRYAGGEKAALRWMAVLFQDTSAAKLQIQWFKSKFQNPSEALIANVAKLDGVLDQMISIFEGTYKTKAPVSFYPAQSIAAAGFGAQLSSRIYHYYVPAYLAARLKSSGSRQALAFFQPFLFNYLYEAIEQDHPLARLVSEPKQLKSTEDSYLGYLGAALGAEISKPMTASAFSKKMSSPHVSLHQILHDSLKTPSRTH